jgi:3-hydroxyacyl-CoA dehydrogenase/enoyl-CoA hydratase/3-hydroxybutyryl-CoA epimerase/3-hydroxyacyl-CoA dehydrogenase/enoyl-CoA hydratase/3-hydroxybutyryl-CoA epimerase/enoyl-CoA isomerase
MGWAQDVVPASQLLAAAIGVVRDEQRSGAYLADRKAWDGPIPISETELGFLGATASAYIQQQTKGNYPAPLAALEVMLGAAGVDTTTALQMEAEGMAALFGSPINASLLNIFFLTDRNKKDRGTDRTDIEPAGVQSVGVVGAGIMGAGIAAASVKREMLVHLTDTSTESLARGVKSVLEEVSYNRETKSADIQRAIDMAPRLNATSSMAEMSQCDVVIEAVVENLDVKRKVFAGLEAIIRPDAILASNTSTIPISSMAEGLKHPQRFCGIHFFNPVRKMKLVEVIRGKQTSDQTVVTAVQYAKSIGKSPIVVNDGPGFLVNRLLMPFMSEALMLLQEGVAIDDIEKAAKKFGMPMGPFTLYDVVGLDTATYAGKVLCDAFPDRFVASPVLPALLEAGRKGQKSGSGFFSYQNKKNRAEPDPALAPVIAPFIQGAKDKLNSQQLQDRLIFPMLVEATRVLDEGIVRDPRDVDLGLIFGIGFPPFRGGLLFWADHVGLPEILKRLAPLAPLGKRFEPTQLLLDLVKDGRKFYDLSADE